MSRWSRANDDGGAVLILALVFITSIILVVGSTLAFSSTALDGYNATHSRQLSRYAAEGAVENLIVTEQGNPTNTGCSGAPTTAVNGSWTAYATCQQNSTGPLPLQRDVTFCAYVAAPAAGSCSSTNGLLLKAEVFFQDTLGASGPTYQGEQIESWSYGQN